MIYLKLNNPPKDINELMQHFFRKHQGQSYFKGVETYSDLECTSVQCPARKYRSFDDLYECVRNYFPGTTAKQVMQCILTTRFLAPAKKPASVSGMLVFHTYEAIYTPFLGSCKDMNKIRIFYIESPYQNSQLCYNYLIDSRGFESSSEYTWGELLEMVGITDEDSMREFENKFPVTIHDYIESDLTPMYNPW